MRFGVYLDHHAVPEWRDRYVAYTRLASLLKPVAAAWKVRRAALTSSAASTASSIFDSTEPLVSIDNVSESADGGDERVSLLAQTTVPFSHTSTLLRRRAASTAASGAFDSIFRSCVSRLHIVYFCHFVVVSLFLLSLSPF